MRAALAGFAFASVACAAGCGAAPADDAPSGAQVVAGVALPPGFALDVLATVPGARQMALGAHGTLFVATARGEVWVVRGARADARAPEASALALDVGPVHGVAIADDTLIVATDRALVRFDRIEARLDDPPPPIVLTEALPEADADEARAIEVGPDGWIYAPVAAACERCDDDAPRGTIVRVAPDGERLEVYARGVRGARGLTFHPATGALWFTDDGADGLGETFPGDELDSAARPGQHFGFPFCHNGAFPDEDLGGAADCSAAGPYTHPAGLFGAHVGATGLAFLGDAAWPSEYRGRVIVAEHGNDDVGDPSEPPGFRLAQVLVTSAGSAAVTPFADGWARAGVVYGRPWDVLELPGGALVVSDDLRGVIYRIRPRPQVAGEAS